MSSHSHDHAAVAPAEVLDPVCGMTISPDDAVGHVDHKGGTYYFCSQSCLDQFRATPDAFLGERPALAATPADMEREYTCPDGSGGAPEGPRRVPEVRNGARTRRRGTGHKSRVDMPDAPGDRAGCPWRMPDLRHGARAADRHARREESRTRRHDAAVSGGRL